MGKTCVFFLCIYVAFVPLTSSARTNLKAIKNRVDRQTPSRSLSPAGKTVLVEFDGFIKLDNNKEFKTITDDSVLWDVKTDDVVTILLLTKEGKTHIIKTDWMNRVRGSSILLRGTAALDVTKTSPTHVLVTAQLTGEVLAEMGSTAVFQRDDMDAHPPILVPLEKVRAMAPGVIDYSVTKVTRGGKTVFAGPDVGLFYPLLDPSMGADAVHKEYVLTEVLKKDGIEFPAEFPLYVKSEGFCGTELFTQPTLTCELKSSLASEVQTAKKLAPTNTRGFGLEFELVSRDPSGGIASDAIASYATDPIPDNVEQFKAEHAMNYKDENEYKQVVEGVQHVNYCFRQSIKSSPRADPQTGLARLFNSSECRGHTDCKLNEFCTSVGKCESRSSCEAEKSKEGKCPLRLSLWNWETDVSVGLLTQDEVDAIPGADASEKLGVGMELVSPGPPNVLSGETGIASAAEVIGILTRQGVQAGPSQGFHVHVNAASSDVPGEPLTLKGIAYVWAAWAKYQLVIDEMLSPGRPDNSWSGRLFLAAGKPWENPPPKDCRLDAATCTGNFFVKMHSYVTSQTSEASKALTKPEDTRDFCNFMFELPGDPTPCDHRYPHQRYSQVNLMPLTRYGTIEFRPHSATADIERIARWVQFLTAFVEHFGTADGVAEIADVFAEADSEQAFAELRDAQRAATMADLFKALGEKVDKDSLSFFEKRAWEDEDAICKASKQKMADKANAGQAQSMLEIKNDFESRKAEIASRPQQTPIEIKVPVPRNGY